jgi:hypothetical protein
MRDLPRFQGGRGEMAVDRGRSGVAHIEHTAPINLDDILKIGQRMLARYPLLRAATPARLAIRF